MEQQSDSRPRIAVWVRALAWVVVGLVALMVALQIASLAQRVWHSGFAAFSCGDFKVVLACLVLVVPFAYAAIIGRAPHWRIRGGGRLSDPAFPWKSPWRRK